MGPFIAHLIFSGYLITADENRVGETFNKTVTNGDSYPAHCHCDTGKVGEFPYIYYTARINEALSYAGVRSNVNYFNLNPNLDVGISGNDSNLLIVFYVQIMPDDFVMQLHRF